MPVVGTGEVVSVMYVGWGARDINLSENNK